MSGGQVTRVIQVGAGSMGRAWLRTIEAAPDVELVGLVDLDLQVARTAASEAGIGDVPLARTLTDLAGSVDADAVVNVTVPEAHRVVNMEAIAAGLPILCEKPIAPTVAEAVAVADAADAVGQLLMISQSRRYFAAFTQLRDVAAQLGTVGGVSCEFFKAPRFGGFRERMAHPLLVDMSIHHFDAARQLLGADPVSVYCETSNPPWSWFDGDAAATAIFEFAGGARFSYTGSWCSPGRETSWNGRWRVSGEAGTAIWNGDDAPVVEAGPGVVVPPAGGEPEQIAGALAEFVRALHGELVPDTVARNNVVSLAMVEGAVRSAASSERVLIDDVLAEARAAPAA